MRVLPVALTKGMRVSVAHPFAHLAATVDDHTHALGHVVALEHASAVMCWQAMLHRGVFSLGFQRHTSPQTHASAVFQLQTATGKLKAVMMPTSP
jgi:hypothetical protein